MKLKIGQKLSNCSGSDCPYAYETYILQLENYILTSNSLTWWICNRQTELKLIWKGWNTWKLTNQVAEIVKKEKFFRNFSTVFPNTTNLLRKGLNTYDLPPINTNKGNVNLIKYKQHGAAYKKTCISAVFCS